MRFVVDTNVLIAGLLRASTTRRILVHPDITFLVPESALDELDRHAPDLARRMGTSRSGVTKAFRELAERIEVVSHDRYAHEMGRARAAVADIDADDAPFVALALACDCPLWTLDRALRGQDVVRVVHTKALLRHIDEA